MAKKDKFQSQVNTFVKNTLRRASLRWPPRNEAIKAARIERGLYQCAMCKNGFKRDQVHLDHIYPVVSLSEGYVDWNEYIARLLVKSEGFQVLCSTCHTYKTSVEDKTRAILNQQRKELDKKKKKE